ncbi:MAG: RpiB/LacA/LacB family sugar-phosphate isomerase [Candidatus Paceibacterota bacterium]
MKVYFASDHAGFELKNVLASYVRERGHEVIDCGAYTYDETDDYPGFIRKAAQMVSRSSGEVRAVILGKTGEGEAMAANRLPNVRAAVYYGGNTKIVSLSRSHNDANVLSLGAGFMDASEAKEAVTLWLATKFSGEARHMRRIRDIEQS